MWKYPHMSNNGDVGMINGLKNAVYPHKGLFNYLAIKRNKVIKY